MLAPQHTGRFVYALATSLALISCIHRPAVRVSRCETISSIVERSNKAISAGRGESTNCKEQSEGLSLLLEEWGAQDFSCPHGEWAEGMIDERIEQTDCEILEYRRSAVAFYRGCGERYLMRRCRV